MKNKKIKVNTIQKNFIIAQLHGKPQCGYDLMSGFKESTGKSLSLYDKSQHPKLVLETKKLGLK